MAQRGRRREHTPALSSVGDFGPRFVGSQTESGADYISQNKPDDVGVLLDKSPEG